MNGSGRKGDQPQKAKVRWWLVVLLIFFWWAAILVWFCIGLCKSAKSSTARRNSGRYGTKTNRKY